MNRDQPHYPVGRGCTKPQPVDRPQPRTKISHRQAIVRAASGAGFHRLVGETEKSGDPEVAVGRILA